MTSNTNNLPPFIASNNTNDTIKPPLDYNEVEMYLNILLNNLLTQQLEVKLDTNMSNKYTNLLLELLKPETINHYINELKLEAANKTNNIQPTLVNN